MMLPFRVKLPLISINQIILSYLSISPLIDTSILVIYLCELTIVRPNYEPIYSYQFILERIETSTLKLYVE